jgi:cytochrome c oxidase subunit II
VVAGGAALALLYGCRGERNPSVLHPAGPAAESIAWLWWLLFGVCLAVLVIVTLLTIIAIFRPRISSDRPPPLGNRFIIISGIILPAIILVVLLILSLSTSRALQMPQTAFTIRIIGHQWWWQVEYPEHDILTANEVHIPEGVAVRLELLAADVIHSFWVPNLQGKMDLLPEHPNHFWIKASRPGVYRGQCAEFCGLQHAKMALDLVVLPAEQFNDWVAQKQRPAAVPADVAGRGQEVFFRQNCHTCHAIRGTAAEGRIGPDLTHIGSRRSLGAGTLPNNRGSLGGWISNPQPLKPGNLMPATPMPPDDLRALLDYLESLQ